MTLTRIEYELPVDDKDRDAALLGFNVDGEMRWTIEAGRDSDGPLQAVERLSDDQMQALVRTYTRFLDGKL